MRTAITRFERGCDLCAQTTEYLVHSGGRRKMEQFEAEDAGIEKIMGEEDKERLAKVRLLLTVRFLCLGSESD